ncbi:MAG TPA: DUF6165 family protein [Rhizomicrobium sp.]|jgi:hypothetical protein|nr:DUF6165 family protein [Rhizomicrobium sp.]
MRVYIPVSAGDLIDRITILQIKQAQIPDQAVAANVGAELEHLTAIRNCFPKLAAAEIRLRERQLRKQNRRLWDTEDKLRVLEARRDFGKPFVAAARRVYRTNDERARLKREINDLAGSALREEKWFSQG